MSRRDPPQILEKDKVSDNEIATRMTGRETAALVDCVQTWRYRVDPRQHGFFLAKKLREDPSDPETGNYPSPGSVGFREEESSKRPSTPGTPGDKLGFHWSAGSLMEYESGFFDGIRSEDQYVCFADPSTYANYPGWMLRNLLVVIRRRWKLDRVQILCYRDIQARRDDAKSIVLSLKLEEGHTPSSSEMPKVTGWERNNAGKVTSRIANLGEYMDPQRYGILNRDDHDAILLFFTRQVSDRTVRLADQAVDLNLKLIKWRIAPAIDLEKIKNTKCLLLGAGTLGSYVARNLMVCWNRATCFKWY